MKTETRRTKDYVRVVDLCYKTDPELIEKYHCIAPANLQDCVLHTVSLYAAEEDNIEMWVILVGGELAAYFCTNKIDLMQGFFIMPEFRNKEFVQKFWRIVRGKLKGKIMCALFTKNTRGISFLKRKGFKASGNTFTVLEKEAQFFTLI